MFDFYWILFHVFRRLPLFSTHGHFRNYYFCSIFYSCNYKWSCFDFIRLIPFLLFLKFEAFPLFRRRGWPHRMFHEPVSHKKYFAQSSKIFVKWSLNFKIYNGFYFHEVVGIFWVCVLFFILSPKILHVPHSVGKLFNINRIQDNQLISQIITGLKVRLISKWF